MNFAAFPWSREVEAAVIGAALADPTVVGRIGPLDPTDFNDALHISIWTAIADLTDGPGCGSSVDVWRKLEAEGADDRLKTRLVDAEESSPGPDFAAHYAALVRRAAVVRRYARSCASAAELAENPENHVRPEDYIRATFDEIRQAAEDFDVAAGSTSCSATDALADEIDALERRIANPDDHDRLETGFPDVDRLIVGFERADYVVLGARPSMGKTALALQLATNVCDQGKAVSFFSLEQSTSKIMQRLIAQQAQVPFGAIRTGKDFGQAMVTRTLAAQNRIRGYKLSVRDDPALTPSAIRAAVAADKASRGCDLVVIDHLHHIRPDVRNDSRYVQVSEISKAIKALAKDLDVPVLLAAQLSRDAHDPKRIPTLRHLRDAGTIEEDADVVALLHRDCYYDPETRPGEADLLIAKCRDGETGRVTLAWRPSFLRFESKAFGP